ncbi:hypothetical Protein YC6258_05708 [Gynuella sunshinyii YC6258]|uniref:Uncharacterized protein n=1 Tax=Gynuella sunshinyii YC6258 TaxID=1445510 RepID=A0A0C5VUA6_9GAMM|nr:hypothetical Protein YC6258_05708 [Gynuella sunshinyii YC6258]
MCSSIGESFKHISRRNWHQAPSWLDGSYCGTMQVTIKVSPDVSGWRRKYDRC